MPTQRNESTRPGSPDGKDFMPMPPAATHTSDAGTGSGAPNEGAKTLMDQAKSTAGEAYDKVAEKATSTLEEKKAGFTDGLTTVAYSIRKAGDSLNNSKDQSYVTEYSAHYADAAAQKLEQTARYFQNNDLKGMARDAEDYARRNPAIFLGGAFVLGVLAARFFKSSPVPPPTSIGQASIGTDHQLEQAKFGDIHNSGASPEAMKF